MASRCAAQWSMPRSETFFDGRSNQPLNLWVGSRRFRESSCRSRALTNDPTSTPTLADWSSISSANAKPAINRAIVKPIPARNPPPTMCRQVTLSGSWTHRLFTKTQLNNRIPTGFSTASPKSPCAIMRERSFSIRLTPFELGGFVFASSTAHRSSILSSWAGCGCV